MTLIYLALYFIPPILLVYALGHLILFVKAWRLSHGR